MTAPQLPRFRSLSTASPSARSTSNLRKQPAIYGLVLPGPIVQVADQIRYSIVVTGRGGAPCDPNSCPGVSER